MANLRAALIGLGAMGKNHARVLKSLPEVDLVAVFDPAVKVGSSELPLVSSFEELIALKPDYCVIATPTFTHEEIAIKLASNGINVLIEKPIAISSESGFKILESVRRNGVIGGVGHIERFNAAAIEAKKKISEGLLGNVYQVATRRQGPFPSRIADVGVIVDLASHDIDLTKWLLDSDYNNLKAFVSKKSGRKHEDLVSASGILNNGVIVNHVVNWLCPFKERSVEILGEHGALRIDTLSSDLTFYENGSTITLQKEIAHFKGVSEGQVVKFAINKKEPLLYEHEAFRDSILRISHNIATLESGLETLRVAERMRD
jgi:UDP-N-acetylglucosamine 3-dehydrogenase